MTDAAASSRIPAPRDHTNVALLGVVITLAVINSAITWFGREINSDFLGAVYVGYLIFQPMALGVWTALGSGSIYTRLPMAVLCNILLFVAPGTIPANFGNVEQIQYVAMVLAGLSIFIVTTLLFLVFRWFTRFRLQSRSHNDGGLQFSMQYILSLMTITAIDLAMVLNLEFQKDPQPQPVFLGPNFFFIIIFFMGTIFSAAVLPTMAVPLSILHGSPSRRAVKWCITFWAVVIVGIVVATFDNGDLEEFIPGILITQFVSSVVGSVVAKALRYSGLQLIRTPSTGVRSSATST